MVRLNVRRGADQIHLCTEDQNTSFDIKGAKMTVSKRRLACPQTVQHMWDSIVAIRQHKQIPNFDRMSQYMRRKHNLNPTDLERQVNFALRDELIVVKKRVGCKGSKVGVEQEGYRLPEGQLERDGHDWYCFECHRGGEVISCSTCSRVYHSFCVKEDLSTAETFICTICDSLKAKSSLKLKREEVNCLLGYTCIRLKEKTRDLHRMPHPEEEVWRYDFLVFEKMDLITMEEKTRNNEYKRIEEFQVDAQTIVHNVVIYYGVHSTMADMARQMLRDCIYDLGEIKQCKDCYHMSNEKMDKFWFCQPCDPPHDLVFAKQKGFPFWPAKVIQKLGTVYDVRFFGAHHQRANIERDYIRPITSLQQLSLKRTASLNRALDELRRHQQHLEKPQPVPPLTLPKDKEEPAAVVKRKRGRPASSSSSRPGPHPRRHSVSSEMRSESEEERYSCNDAMDDEASVDEFPTSSSPKVPRLQETPIPDDHNVVSSSSQESPNAKVTVSTQTHKKLMAGMNVKGKTAEISPTCNCDTKYSKMFKDNRERLEAEFKEEKEKCMRELAERLRKEFEEEKTKDMQIAREKYNREVDLHRRKCEDQVRLLREVQERHKQEISDIKKKQWCYNCEAEAIYHCCWNTSYCSVECQQVHWHKEHKRTCRRKR